MHSSLKRTIHFSIRFLHHEINSCPSMSLVRFLLKWSSSLMKGQIWEQVFINRRGFVFPTGSCGEKKGIKEHRKGHAGTPHRIMNHASHKHCYSVFYFHERHASLSLCLFYGTVLSVRWQSLFSTGRHRTSWKPWASGSERLSGQPHDIKKSVFKN